MGKHITFTFLSLLFIIACKTPQRDCASFKTGEFSYEELIEGALVTTRFTRNDTLEVAYFNNKVDSSSVRWINDCEWIVKKINPKSMSEEKAVHMKILYTEGEFYTFEYSLVGKTKKQRGTAKKLN
ncbi:DNA topoisomerase IV [uncultured Dokdonia sp.]|uniref:DNA topoisomerase IV n=1 Tax=uncultured Dokdonia sp. TaxID=575653 RepID=UPI002606CCE3|nr:DNA topoisomerase IV [uncultured Dokdonia sp.]